MVFSELTEKAMSIAYEAHDGQCDFDGVPYIYHPARVGSCFDDEVYCAVGFLHDVVEDTNVTIEKIYESFPVEVADAVRLLTHAGDAPYMDYIEALSGNVIARLVKIADLRDNLRREPHSSKMSVRRMEKHRKALAYLLSKSI